MRNYRKAGIASTFSPTHRAVLAEAFSFLSAIGASAEIWHAAERTDEKDARFRRTLEDLGESAELVYLADADPCGALVRAVSERGIDLLVAGALEREPHSHERSFTGSVARRLLVEAPCDVLLLPQPVEQPPRISSAFFAIEPGQDCAAFIGRAVQVLGLRRIVLGVIETPFAAAIALARGEEPVDLQEWSDDLAAGLLAPGLEVEVQIVDSNTGFGICDAARSGEVELLIASAPRIGGEVRLPSHLDWMRQVIPTRLLLCGR